MTDKNVVLGIYGMSQDIKIVFSIDSPNLGDKFTVHKPSTSIVLYASDL